MFISVIIPVYNKGDLLDHCIKSVSMQTYKNIEIIIINDGSIDNSEEIIFKWLNKDERIRYYKHENSGVSLTRNRGIKLAKGQYIYFLDADDELVVNALEVLSENVQDSKADIVMGNYIHLKNNTEIRRPKPLQSKYSQTDMLSTSIKMDLFITNSRLLSMVSNKLYKLDFIKKHKIEFDSNVLAEDRLFNLKCFVNIPSIIAINHYTYIYKYFDNSRSQSLKPYIFDESIKLLYIFEKYVKSDPLYNNENNNTLMELLIIYDIYKLINTVFYKSENKIKDTKRIIYKLKQNKLIMSNLNSIINGEKYIDVKYNRAFSRMRLLSYLLYKFPTGILIYKYLGLLKKKFYRS